MDRCRTPLTLEQIAETHDLVVVDTNAIAHPAGDMSNPATILEHEETQSFLDISMHLAHLERYHQIQKGKTPVIITPNVFVELRRSVIYLKRVLRDLTLPRRRQRKHVPESLAPFYIYSTKLANLVGTYSDSIHAPEDATEWNRLLIHCTDVRSPEVDLGTLDITDCGIIATALYEATRNAQRTAIISHDAHLKIILNRSLSPDVLSLNAAITLYISNGQPTQYHRSTIALVA